MHSTVHLNTCVNTQRHEGRHAAEDGVLFMTFPPVIFSGWWAAVPRRAYTMCSVPLLRLPFRDNGTSHLHLTLTLTFWVYLAHSTKKRIKSLAQSPTASV